MRMLILTTLVGLAPWGMGPGAWWYGASTTGLKTYKVTVKSVPQMPPFMATVQVAGVKNLVYMPLRHYFWYAPNVIKAGTKLTVQGYLQGNYLFPVSIKLPNGQNIYVGPGARGCRGWGYGPYGPRRGFGPRAWWY